MIKLLLISDDFTGALDTGIQFAQYGADTKIITTSDVEDGLFYGNDMEVLVIDAETRHLSCDEAYRKVYSLSRAALLAGVKHIYKKTDSGLRGNIGSELKALLDASGEGFLPFIPAYPLMNRVTINGCHYVDGMPIKDSVFGKDPFEPVRISRIRELFDTQTRVEQISQGVVYDTVFDTPAIGIFDAQTDTDIKNTAEHLSRESQLKIMAGCAGFASFLPEFLHFNKKKSMEPVLSDSLLVMCGSMNPISKEQITYAERMGFGRIVLTPRQQFEMDYLSSSEGVLWLESLEKAFSVYPVVMLDTGDSDLEIGPAYTDSNKTSLHEIRIRISQVLGEIAKRILNRNGKHTLMIIGGDTLLGFFNRIHCDEINPICELDAGSVLSNIDYKERKLWIISKSGGFGKEDAIYQIAIKLGLAEEQT